MKSWKNWLSAVARRLLSFLARHDRIRKIAKRVMYRLPWVKRALMALASNAAQTAGRVEGPAYLPESAKIVFGRLISAYQGRQEK
jgi:hypothetical protein